MYLKNCKSLSLDVLGHKGDSRRINLKKTVKSIQVICAAVYVALATSVVIATSFEDSMNLTKIISVAAICVLLAIVGLMGLLWFINELKKYQ